MKTGRSSSSIAVYVGSLLVLLVLVASGYKSPSVQADDTQLNSTSKSTTTVSSVASEAEATIDESKAASLAAAAASSANLSVSDSVSEQAISVNTTADLGQYESTAVNKPQIIDPMAKIDAVSSYVAVDGDDANTIAAKFGISSQTLKWANNLTSDTVTVGSTVKVPAVDGVVYTVKSGDTIDSLVSKYGSSADSLISVNNLDGNDLPVGTQILIPGGVLPESERPGYQAPARRSSGSSSVSASTSYVPYYGGNTYAYGYCTWYAYNRRAQMGMQIPSNWGNANTWDNRAAAAGYSVNRTPSVGAIFQSDAGYAGHVGVVEEVYADGTIRISEMNAHFGPGTGWGKISYRTITNPGSYKYIH